MTLPPIIEPDASDSARTDVVERLAACLHRPEDAEWIADPLVAFAESQHAETRSVFHRPHQFVDTTCRGVGIASPRDANLFALLLSAVNIATQRQVTHHGISSTVIDGRGRRAAIRALVPRWREAEPPIDFAAGLHAYLEQIPNEGARWIDPEVIRELVALGALAPHRMVDVELLGGVNLPGDDHPRNVLYWARRLGGRVLDSLLPLVQEAADDRVGKLAWTLLERLQFIGQTESLWVVHRPPSIRSLRAWLDALEGRAASVPHDLFLLRARLLLAREMVARRPDALSDAQLRRLLDAAQGAFDGLRKELAAAPSHDAGDSEKLGRHYNALLESIGLLSDPSRALRTMLVTLRSIREPVSGADLRYWTETEKGPEDQPPLQWRWFADSLVGTVHWYAREHREDDAELVALREELAKFLLERLKSRPGRAQDPGDLQDADFVDPSPIWRRAYLRAIRELRINPDSRGHRVLHWLSAHDPHAELRREAATAYGEMTRPVLLAPGVSPRRAVIAALWWLRQAQRQELGLHVDPKGAQRTRQKESRRTKEVEELELLP